MRRSSRQSRAFFFGVRSAVPLCATEAASSRSATGQAVMEEDFCPTSRWARIRRLLKPCAATSRSHWRVAALRLTRSVPGITDDSIVNRLPRPRRTLCLRGCGRLVAIAPCRHAGGHRRRSRCALRRRCSLDYRPDLSCRWWCVADEPRGSDRLPARIGGYVNTADLIAVAEAYFDGLRD